MITRRWGKRLLVAVIGRGVLFGVVKYVHLQMTLTDSDWLYLLGSAAAAFLRVVISVVLFSPSSALVARLATCHSDGG